MINAITFSAQVNTHPDDLHENKSVAAIIVVIIFALAVWKAWPSLMANNVFSKKRLYDYGRGEELLTRKRSAALNILAGTLLLGLGGILTLLYRMTEVGSQSHLNAEVLFIFSLTGTIATFIYINLDGSSFAEVHNLKYSLKVWLTAFFISPLLLVLMDHHRVVSAKIFFRLYFNTLILGHGVAVVTLALLILATHYFTAQPWKLPKKRLYILLTAEVALLINMLVIALIMRSGLGWLLEVLPYMVTMGLAICFYPMDATVYSKITDAEVID